MGGDMKKNHILKAFLICTILLSALAACSLPNLKPYADATAQLHTVVIQTDAIARLSLTEAGAEKMAKKLGDQLSVRISAMEAVVKYTDALATIADAGQKGSDNAGNLADALDGFLGAVSAPTMPTNYVAMAKSVYGIVANVRAASSLAKATEKANPAIQSIAAIMIKDFDDLKEILMVTGKKLNSKLISEKANNEIISYRLALEKRRRQIENEITPDNIDQNKLKELQKVNALIDTTRDRYEPLMKKIKDLEDRTAIQIKIVESSKKGLVQWAAIHESLANNLKNGLPPNSRLIASTVIKLRELIKKEDRL
jgi:hypothetical protein